MYSIRDHRKCLTIIQEHDIGCSQSQCLFPMVIQSRVRERYACAYSHAHSPPRLSQIGTLCICTLASQLDGRQNCNPSVPWPVSSTAGRTATRRAGGSMGPRRPSAVAPHKKPLLPQSPAPTPNPYAVGGKLGAHHVESQVGLATLRDGEAGVPGRAAASDSRDRYHPAGRTPCRVSSA